MDENGQVTVGTNSSCGLYRDDTRYLSQWEMTLNGMNLTPLSHNTNDGYAGRFIYANHAYPEHDSHATQANMPAKEMNVGSQKLMVQRDLVIRDAVIDRVVVTNFDTSPVEGQIDIKYGADFADIFEVRGMARKRRGELLPVQVAGLKKQVVLAYRGLDGQVMKTKISFIRQTPVSISSSEAHFEFKLHPKGVYIFETVVTTNFNEPDIDPLAEEKVDEPKKNYTYLKQKTLADTEYAVWRGQCANFITDNDTFNRLLERDFRDLYILRQHTPKGECVAAGVPWYGAAFGRDEDIVGHELVALMPQLTKSILELLANYQGVKYDSVTEERPGKIMHELRLGEMARCKEIAFRPYYGSIDATPLWLSLLAEYVDWSGDLNFARAHWSNVVSALNCLDRESTSGYLTYGDKANSVLANQGWKDSFDAIVDARGRTARPPIALCEVQGYLYSAWKQTAKLARAMGEDKLAKNLEDKASALKDRFNRDFYSQHHDYIVLALDGDGKQCDVLSSNPAHLLASGILDASRTESVTTHLMNVELFTGWGIRTLSALEAAYNPISYHNGSIWPHDNALAVEGLCKSGHAYDAIKVTDGMFAAAQGHLNLRLPELFCGFSKRFSDPPVWYPVSCEPQAWAAGSMFLMLDSGLGFSASAANNELHIVKPVLPPFLSNVQISNLRVGDSTANITFARANGEVNCSVDSTTNGLKVLVDK